MFDPKSINAMPLLLLLITLLYLKDKFLQLLENSYMLKLYNMKGNSVFQCARVHFLFPLVLIKKCLCWKEAEPMTSTS